MRKRGLLLDLDGVLYISDQAIPGAAATLAWVKEQDIPLAFLTNTTSQPRAALAQKLATMGIIAEAENILTPPIAAHAWLRTNHSKRIALLVPDAIRSEFSGLAVTDDLEDPAIDTIVIGDLAERWDFALLNQLFRLLMREPKPALLALGMTRYWRTPRGLQLDVGPFVAALQYASDINPVVLGKPSGDFFHAALRMIDCKAAEAIMVGDDILGDVDGAQHVGITGVLVQTGKFQPKDLNGDIRPDGVLDLIADLPTRWVDLQ